MKNIYFLNIFFSHECIRCSLCSLLLWFFCSNPVFALDTIQINSGEWQPLASQTPNARLGEKIVEAAFQAVGLQVKFSYMPWERAYLSTKAVNGDATILYAKNEDREKEMFYSRSPILTIKSVIFYRSDLEINWNELSDLNPFRIGGMKGYSSSQTFEKAGLQVEYVTSIQQNLEKLVLNRIDLFPSSELNGLFAMHSFLDKEQQKIIAIHPKPLAEEPLFLIVSKSHPQAEKIIEAFDNGLQIIKQSGRYDQLISVLGNEK